MGIQTPGKVLGYNTCSQTKTKNLKCYESEKSTCIHVSKRICVSV